MANRYVALAAALGLIVVGCSGGDGSPAASSVTVATVPASRGLPAVDQIRPAISALEAELGGPQQYFEINATPRLVNLFVALNGGKLVVPWVFFDGKLTSSDGQGADGNVFTAAQVDFDPATVLTKVVAELPGSVIDSFVIEGTKAGPVHYTVVVSSSGGRQLVVDVDSSGKVLAVDPN